MTTPHPTTPHLTPEQIADAVTGMVADHIGERLYRYPDDNDGVPQARNWYQTSLDTAEFDLVDGTRITVIVTVHPPTSTEREGEF